MSKNASKSVIPPDLSETYDYVVEFPDGGSVSDNNSIRMLVRKSRLGEAYELVSTTYPSLKATIKMPVPRQPPWKEIPVLMICARHTARPIWLDDSERANMLSLLYALGFRGEGVEPFTLARGEGWVASLGLKLEELEANGYEPDFTCDELRDGVNSWLNRQSTAADPADKCPNCGSADVMIQNGMRGCRGCGATTVVHPTGEGYA